VSGVAVRSGAAIFPGDTIATGAGSAIVALSNSRTIRMGANAEVRLAKETPATVEILKGMSRMQSKSEPFTVMASNWSLQGQPDSKTGLLTADVVRTPDGKVSVNVSSGRVAAHSSRGNVVMMAQAGRPIMLPAGLPADPAPQAGGSGKSSGGGTSPLLIGAYVVGAVAVGVGVAAIATQDDNSGLKTQITALSTQLSTISTQNAALTTQISSLLAQVNALSAAAAAIKGLTDQLNAQVAILVAAQAALAADQTIITNLIAKLASGQTLTAADQAALAAAQADVARQSTAIAGASSQINNISNKIRNCSATSATTATCN
jgi:cell division protein FtsB